MTNTMTDAMKTKRTPSYWILSAVGQNWRIVLARTSELDAALVDGETVSVARTPGQPHAITTARGTVLASRDLIRI